MQDPSKATPEQAAKAVQTFEHLIEKVPGTMWAGRSQLMIGTIHLAQKQFDEARQSYNLVLQNYNRFGDLALRARVAIAKSYEAENRWNDAVAVYKDISEYHPWSQLGLEAPLYIAATYEKRKEPSNATSAYERAVRIYSHLIPDAPQPEMAMQVKGYLTLAYQRLGRWSEAIALLEEMAQAPGGVNRPLVLLTLGSIYQSKLGNTAKADEAYQRVMREFPDNPLGKVAKAQHEQLTGSKSAPQSSGAAAPTPASDASTPAAPSLP